jgi:ABC-2 type transport system ATP-binding protein
MQPARLLVRQCLERPSPDHPGATVTAIELEDLRVAYRGRRGSVIAVNGLSLSVPTGGVFGFLGANGAGKTTAIRAIVGLLRSSTGRIRVLDADVPRRLPDVMDRVGALVEQPSFFPNFSGRRNLVLLARARGIGAKRVDAAIEQVGLAPRAESRFATYSLGMKQRLGIAAALLKDPDLVVLDEPANGLDPPGILEVRTLLRELGAQGRTVFVSSHLLSEVEHMCDRVAIIAHGRCIATGRVDELLAGGHARHRVRLPDPSRQNEIAIDALARAGWNVTIDDEGALLVEVGADRSFEVSRTLAAINVFVAELAPVTRSLEDVFLELTRADDAGSRS